MADAVAPRKQDRDFTNEVGELLPTVEAQAEASHCCEHRLGCNLTAAQTDRPSRPVAQSGNLQEALDQLLALEKQTRNVRRSSVVLSWPRSSPMRRRLPTCPPRRGY